MIYSYCRRTDMFIFTYIYINIICVEIFNADSTARFCDRNKKNCDTEMNVRNFNVSTNRFVSNESADTIISKHRSVLDVLSYSYIRLYHSQ